ncbi:MAG TPA: TonB-dependent receptor [Vicinamibacterales bacterium]|nr:TonB-dependent receptor [Vicinamibacterales bacterium]
MGRHLIRALLLVIAAALPAFAQTTSATTATVLGTVADASGGTLPGVTVNLSGASMMGVQSTVTSEDGGYRFISVPPGEYKLTFDLPGFATVTREAVRLTSNFTATINVTMGMAALAENVTVTGASPVVDTQSTSISTTFDKETLANLPSARDYWAILSEAPGVKMQRIDVGGSAAGTQTTYSVYGTTGQVRPMVEGINSTEGTNAFGNYVDYGSFEEVSIGSGASSAESPVPGVFTQLISKSGGNTYHGSFYGDKEFESFQSYNIDAAQVASGVSGGGGLQPRDTNRLSSYSDKNADIGGFLKKDKLWWYASVRGLDSSVRYTNYPVDIFKTELRNFTTKGTYQLSQNNKLIGYYGPSSKVQPTRLDRQLLGSTAAIHLATDDSFQQDYHPKLWKAEWNSVLSNTVFFEVRSGAFGYDWLDTPNGKGLSYEDLNTSIVSGKARERDYKIKRNQILGSLSYLKQDMLGDHSFKFGGEWFRETQTASRFAGSFNDTLMILRSGVPSEVMLFEPAASENGLYVFGSYAQDTWKVTNRLTVNLGLRFDYYRNFLPEQTHDAFSYTAAPIVFAPVSNLMSWKLPAPRLGITYALTEDGKTVLKGNYGKYYWNPGAQLSQDNNPNPEVWFRRYVWNDLNGDRVYQSGEEGRLNSSAGGVATQIIDPNLKDSFTTEAAGWIERELLPNFGVRSGVVWRGERQLSVAYNVNRPFDAYNVPVQIKDPGPDGIANTGDDGPFYTMYNLSAEALAKPVVNTYTNVPNAKSDYYTFEITGTKRMSNKWSGLMSYSKTWSAAQAATFFGTGFRQDALPVAPYDLINTEADGKVKYTDWSLKLNGTYQAPWGFKISPMLRTQAGANYGRTFSAVLNSGTVRVPAEPLNTRRQDLVAVFDFRAEKVMTIGTAKIAPFLDVYNVTNSNANVSLTWASGSSYLRPTAILPPRIARIGAKVSW